MPPRLGARKSRGGCLRCKSRKVKCDEHVPACSWCKAHSLRCEYPRPRKNMKPLHEPLPASSPASTTKAGSPSPEQSLPLGEESSQRRQLELGLFHYYVVTIAPTFPYIDPNYGHTLHADIVPQLGLRCSSLLYAMYAYALLHLHIENTRLAVLPRNINFFGKLGLHMNPAHKANGNGNDKASVDKTSLAFTLHRDYLDRALAEHLEAVSSVTSDNADAVCLTAILIAMTALVHASQEASIDGQSAYAIPLQWFYLFRSFSVCFDMARPLLKADSATITMVNAYPQHLRKDLLSASSSKFRHLLDWQPYPQPETMDDAAFAAYETIFLCIENIHSYIISNEPWQALGRQILAFPSIASDLFVTFLKEKRPRALVMLAHLLAMSKDLDEKWWVFRGVADIHVRGLSTIVPNEWQWALSWPLQILSQGGVLRSE